jgi:hypothetical protein
MSLSRPQLRSARAPGQLICVQLNLKSGLLNIIAVPFTDIALLLIMLIGLFRLRGHGSSTFGMTKVLWRQVCYVFLLLWSRLLRSTNMFSCWKGVFWLLVAIAAEIPPVVSLTNFLLVDFLFIWSLCIRYSLFWI